MHALENKYIAYGIVEDDGYAFVTGRVKGIISEHLLLLERVYPEDKEDTPPPSDFLLDIRDLASEPLDVNIFSDLHAMQRHFEHMNKEIQNFNEDDDLPGSRPIVETKSPKRNRSKGYN